MWLELYLMPKRYHLKQNRIDYQPLFGKGARASKAASREQRKSSVKTEMRVLFYCYLHECILKDTLKVKNFGVSS